MIIEKVYGPYYRKDKGRYIIVLKLWGGKRKYTNYARYLLEQKLKRNLSKKEQADHIDENKINDNLSNLQVLSNKQNTQKHCKKNPKIIPTHICSLCGEIFQKSLCYFKFLESPKFCNKSCANKYRHAKCRKSN